MTAVRIVVLCVAGAMICSALRVHRPEIATAAALAAGVLTLSVSLGPFGEITDGLKRLLSLAEMEGRNASIVLKAAGITIIADLGVQICSDAGESALAGRIRLGVRAALLAMSMPMICDVLDAVSSVLG